MRTPQSADRTLTALSFGANETQEVRPLHHRPGEIHNVSRPGLIRQRRASVSEASRGSDSRGNRMAG